MNILHVALPDEWERSDAEYVPDSFASEGFIHCCYRDQLEGVLARYFSGRDTVLILEVDPESLNADVRAEESTGGELFPHVYGPIDRKAVVRISKRSLS